MIIYPNPNQGEFVIDKSFKVSSVTYTITALDGRIVESGTVTEDKIQIDLSSESSGVYFINIQNEQENRSHKMIKL